MDLRERAVNMLISVEEREIVSWLDHPCTRYFKLALKADLEEMKEFWCEGGYTVDGDAMNTVQRNAEAVGKAGAVQDVLETIEGLKDERKRSIEESTSDTSGLYDFS